MKIHKLSLWLFTAIFLATIVLTTILAAPANSLNSGSTYGRSPDGYGAWYAFMSERETPVQRWQRPFQDLLDNRNIKSPATLLRVDSDLKVSGILGDERKWVEKGNTIVILGVSSSVTEAPFSTVQDSPAGKVKIDTRRRNKYVLEKILGDRFGAVVWKEKIGKGQVIYSTTPYLAANAYQDLESNYEFLARLVSQNGQTVWVDEYIQGYKDLEVIKEEKGENIFSYLIKTPLFPALIQGAIVLLVAASLSLYRFGQPLTLTGPIVENSEAYIQALAGVLQKAGSTDFVFEMVGREEQLQLQKALGLGENLADRESLIAAWVRETGRSAAELEQVLALSSRLSESNLLSWIEKWRDIRHHLAKK